MKKRFAFAVGLACLMVPAALRADLANFADYELGGVSASWDIFYGDNYLPEFSFDGGTAGNPLLGASSAVTLTAEVPNWVAASAAPQFGAATGPIGTGDQGAEIPGNREQFYTLWGAPVNFSIQGTTGEVWDSVVFQFNGSGILSPEFNGVSPTTSDYDSVSEFGLYVWEEIGLGAGQPFDLSWSAGGQHHAYDAFQLQAGPNPIPEPTTVLLVLMGLGIWGLSRYRKGGAA